MIRIKTIHIEEFRGVRSLDLDLAEKNFGICGPNGTGKSGVVDAIEFCLTGSITRLSGQGAGELTIIGHAPHVDKRMDPNKAIVSMTVLIPSLGKTATITRTVKNPRKVVIKPSGGPEETAIRELRSHPEFALSRREIVKYIITPPNQRSKDVQNLLRLDHIEKLRSALVNYSNKCKRDADEAERTHKRAEDELMTALGIDTLEQGQILAKVNEKRLILDLPELTELTPSTTFQDAAAEDYQQKSGIKFNREVALADLDALIKAVATPKSDDPATQVEAEAVKAAANSLKALKDDQAALAVARQHGFIETGLEFVSDDACPLCDTPWEAETLRAYLKKNSFALRLLRHN